MRVHVGIAAEIVHRSRQPRPLAPHPRHDFDRHVGPACVFFWLVLLQRLKGWDAQDVPHPGLETHRSSLFPSEFPRPVVQVLRNVRPGQSDLRRSTDTQDRFCILCDVFTRDTGYGAQGDRCLVQVVVGAQCRRRRRCASASGGVCVSGKLPKPATRY